MKDTTEEPHAKPRSHEGRGRNISFFLTTEQFLAGTKDVTRRLGWKNLKPGERLKAVRKAQGLKRGETLEILGIIEVVKIRRERLDTITRDDVIREGFPDMSPQEFVEMFCRHMKCNPDMEVTRIEFRNLRGFAASRETS